jgi:hypothetical protein
LPERFARLADNFSSAPAAATEQAFALKKADGLPNCRPGDAELGSQIFQGWYCLLQTPFAGFDLVAKMNDKLDIDRRSAAKLQINSIRLPLLRLARVRTERGLDPFRSHRAAALLFFAKMIGSATRIVSPRI